MNILDTADTCQSDNCPDNLAQAKFHIYQGRNVGIQPPKVSKFRILAINLPLRGHSFAYFFTKFSDFIRVYRKLLKFLIWLLLGDKQPSYKHFLVVGAFSLKFSIAPRSETTDRIKKN